MAPARFFVLVFVSVVLVGPVIARRRLRIGLRETLDGERAAGRQAGIPGWGFSPRQQIAVPTGRGVPNVVGTNLPHLTGSQDAYHAWVSNATLAPPDGNMTIMTGRDQEDMTDMERKVLVAQKSLQQVEASQKVEASTVEARFEIERNELMGFQEKQKRESERVADNENRIRQMKSEVTDLFRELARREKLKRDPALSDACSPGFSVYFSLSMEQRLGRDDKRVIAKALKDQYCDLQDMTCLCDEKKKKKGDRVASPQGDVRSKVDCHCATKLPGTYKAPLTVDDMLRRLGHRDLVDGRMANSPGAPRAPKPRGAGAYADKPPGEALPEPEPNPPPPADGRATPSLPGAPPLPVQQAAAPQRPTQQAQ